MTRYERHLLGGDESTAMEYIEHIVREHDRKCLDMELSGAELSQASVDAMSERAKSCKGGETIKSGGECDGKIMESGENHQIEATITDELRDCVNTATKTYDDTPWHEMGEDSEADHTICHITEGELLRIADRIDEWFKRLCEQQEAVLQKTIDGMVDERDELQKKLDRSRAEYCETCEEAKTTDILRAKLDAIREVLDG